ncbi:RNA polymerase sigma factor [Algibacillus agarilyticus]|uniref:RNA polymerase sigma factor n=1 Tax=Algibacillus agarilyticus TaxID=2234133 RepID=UPI000DD0AB68|nr:sigma-70 family RNA polymerase sigma factor [Algibacillus agarilyticus]
MLDSTKAHTIADAEIVLKVRQGDVQAYALLVKRYEPSVRACLRVRLANTHEAEDLAQEAFILAYNKLDEFDETRPLGAWIRGIAINLLKNHTRKLRPVAIGSDAELELLINQNLEQHDDDHNESLSIEALKSCLTKLDDKMHTLMLEHYTQGFSVAELTRKYKIRHSAMTMRMHRIRQKLKDCIELTLRAMG